MRRTTAVVVLLAACSQNPPPATGIGAWEDATARYAAFSLGDQRSLSVDLGLTADSLSDSALARLMSLRLTLPPRVTVGVLNFPAAGSTPRSWSARRFDPDLTAALSESTLAALQAAPRVQRAIAVPALVVGEQPTPATLRTLAARFQVDLLLLYRPSCRIWERAPFIGRTEYRTVCTVQSVLVDTRSGLIPFSAITTAADTTHRQSGDTSPEAVVLRSQTVATLAALRDLARSAGGFLATVPERSP